MLRNNPSTPSFLWIWVLPLTHSINRHVAFYLKSFNGTVCSKPWKLILLYLSEIGMWRIRRCWKKGRRFLWKCSRQWGEGKKQMANIVQHMWDCNVWLSRPNTTKKCKPNFLWAVFSHTTMLKHYWMCVMPLLSKAKIQSMRQLNSFQQNVCPSRKRNDKAYQ